MKKELLLICLLVCIGQVAFSQTAFSSGSLSVLRIGDGDEILNTKASPVFIDEYSTNGELIRSIPLPTSTSNSGNRRLTLSGNLSAEGSLSLSQDGKKLTFAGYDAEPGTVGVSTTSSEIVNRVVAIVDALGNIDTKTALNIYNSNAVRSAVINGNDLWITGSTSRIHHATVGATSSTSIATAGGRTIRVFNKQLYVSQSGGSKVSVSSIGKGLPTTPGQVLEPLEGVDLTGSSSEFFLADINKDIPGYDVLYVANTSLSNGITKYSKLANNTWVSNGVITKQYTGLTGVVSGNEVILYGVKFVNSKSSQLVKVVDNTGYNSKDGKFSELKVLILAKTPSNTVFRGVSFSPQ